MRKRIVILGMLLFSAIMSFQMNADMWIIGSVSPYGWNPSKGLQMITTDGNVYSVEINVTTTGKMYFGLTSKLGASNGDWDAIRPFRYGGGIQVAFETETVLTQNTDASPYCDFQQAGTYEFIFTMSTKSLKVVKKSTIELPPFNGTIYISKGSAGNIWAWDAKGNYATNEWPGDKISTLSTINVNGTEYYYFTYTHNSTSPGLIFNDGSAQTPDITPENGKVYTYKGGSVYTVDSPGVIDTIPETGELYVIGEVNGNAWAANVGVKMEKKADNVFEQKVAFDGEHEGYNYFSFTKKLAESDSCWNDIAPYRFGANSADDFLITEELLGAALGLGLQGSSTAFEIAEGEYLLSVNLANGTLTVTVPNYPILGDVNGDGILDVSDVTALINAILEQEEKTPVCDIDGNGVVNVSDVTALINLLLD